MRVFRIRLSSIRSTLLAMALLGTVIGCSAGISTRSEMDGAKHIVLFSDEQTLAQRDRLMRRVNAVRTQYQIPAIG